MALWLQPMPVPKHVTTPRRCDGQSHPSENVDGFHPQHVRQSFHASDRALAAVHAALAVHGNPAAQRQSRALASKINPPIASGHRGSDIVAPAGGDDMPDQCNATVTLCHSKTRDLPACVAQMHDILVVLYFSFPLLTNSSFPPHPTPPPWPRLAS